MFYKNFIRPLLFLLDPEVAHDISTSILSAASPMISPLIRLQKYWQYHSARLAQRVANIDFPGPVGLAAGFDKTGQLYPIFAYLGFDFIECGTFTAQPQKGNPTPRLFRLPKQKALINRMGFNNPGADQASELFAEQKLAIIHPSQILIPRGINIGKTKRIPFDEAAYDYAYSIKKLAPYAHYITINISSPNTPGLRKLQKKERLHELLQIIQNESKNAVSFINTSSKKRKNIPLFVKVAPDIDYKELDDILDVLLANQVAAIIIANTSLDHSMIPSHLQQEGGLSGRPIQDKSTALIRHCFKQVGKKLAIVGVGGIDSGKVALKKIQAGANLIQVYTGYVYEGPNLPLHIHQYIDRFLEKEGATIKEIVGIEA